MAAAVPAGPASRPATDFHLPGLLAAFAALVVVLLLPTPQGLPYAGRSWSRCCCSPSSCG
jgi:hypothetical protein